MTAALILLLVAGPTCAQAPNVSTYQGRLQESGLPVSGVRMVEVRLCDALSGGSCYPAAGAASQGVTVLNGVFKTTFTIPSGVDLSTRAWFMEVAVGLPAGALNTMSPREQLSAIPYAVYASSATKLLGTIAPSQVVSGALGSGVIAQGFFDQAITNRILADGAVSTAKLQTASVETVKLARDSVDSSKILNGAVGTSKLALGAVNSAKLALGAVDTLRLATDSVDVTKILDGSVQTSKLATAAVSSSKLASSAVWTFAIADAAVATAKIAGGAVDSYKLADSSVSTSKLAAGSVSTSKLAADAVARTAILNLAVDSSKLAAGAVSTAKLAASAVTSPAIADGAVGTLKISHGAVDTARLGNSSVIADKFGPAALMRGSVGLDGLGAMTRMASATGFGTITLNVPGRKHLEVFVHVPQLVSPTDLRVQLNGLSAGAYAVTRMNGTNLSSTISGAGIDVLGGAQFTASSQLHLRLTVDGNTGTPSFVTGTFQAGGFSSPAVAPILVTGAFGVNVGGNLITSISVLGIGVALPNGTYVAVYGEDFP